MEEVFTFSDMVFVIIAFSTFFLYLLFSPFSYLKPSLIALKIEPGRPISVADPDPIFVSGFGP